MSNMPINRSLKLYFILLEVLFRIRQSWLMAFLIMFKRLVATNNKKMKPPTVMYQLPPTDLTFSTIDRICSEVSAPNTFWMGWKIETLISVFLKIMLKMLTRITRIGVKENNVKKAVALARIRGSFRLSWRNASLNIRGILFRSTVIAQVDKIISYLKHRKTIMFFPRRQKYLRDKSTEFL